MSRFVKIHRLDNRKGKHVIVDYKKSGGYDTKKKEEAETIKADSSQFKV